MARDFSDLLRQGLGKYELLEFLHKNGEERAVFRGRNRITREEVAVKVLAIEPIFGSRKAKKMLERFEREAYWVANLRHHDIVPIIDYIEEDDLFCIVMPFYRHGTLGDLIEQQGQISLEDTVRFINQIAPALDHAHAQNIIHRDIKPSNFLLAQNGRLVLSDFGIARQTGNTNWESLTSANALPGTAGFIDPEVVQGKKADQRADIYALGMVIYEMLHGFSPFTARDFMAIILQQIQTSLPSLHEQHPEIPRAVDRVLRRATAKERIHRYNSASELAAALAQAAAEPTPYNAPTEADIPFSNPVYSTVSPKPTSSPKRSILGSLAWFSLAMVLLLLIGGFILVQNPVVQTHFSSAPPTVWSIAFTPGSSETNVQQALDHVEAYYKDWNSDNYQAAYNLLNPDYQKTYPYTPKAYADVYYSCINIQGTKIVTDEAVQVKITINALEKPQSGSGTVTNEYSGYFMVQQVQGEWRLAPHLNIISNRGSCIRS